MKTIRVLTTTLIFFSIAFAAKAQVQTEFELKNLLDEYETVFEEVSVMMGKANWNVYANEGNADQDTPKKKYYELFNDPTLNNAINYWSQRKEKITDKALKRRVEVWNDVLTGAAVDFDTEISMLENKLEELLSNPGESDTAYTAEELNEMVLDLMKMRNAKAIELGYDNYAQLHFEINGLGWDWMYEVIDLIDKKTLEPYKELIAKLKEENGIDTLGYREAMGFVGQVYRLRRFLKVDSNKNDSLMKETMANIGYNYDALPIRFVVENIPYGGNGLAIQIPDDFRVVMKPGMPLSVWMHELGHGLHAMFNNIESPILKGYEWCMGNQTAAFAEGMAETAVEFVRNEKWIKKYAENNDEELIERENIIRKYAPAYLRYGIISFLFEMEFYKDLNQDPSELSEKLYKKYLLLEEPMNRPLNLSENIFYVAYPLYFQNYYLSRMISRQVHKAIENKFGEDYVFNKEVGNYLIENYYGEGELKTWRDKLKEATGKELDIVDYLKSVGIE